MIRQPLQRLSGMQASDIDIYRRVTREKTGLMVRPWVWRLKEALTYSGSALVWAVHTI